MYTATFSIPRDFPIRIFKNGMGTRFYCLSDVCQFLGISRDTAADKITYFLRDDANEYKGIDALMSHTIDGVSYLFITRTQLYVLMYLTEFKEGAAMDNFLAKLWCLEHACGSSGED